MIEASVWFSAWIVTCSLAKKAAMPKIEPVVPVLRLHTLHAERLYLRLGWQHAGVEQEEGHNVTLMQRELFAL